MILFSLDIGLGEGVDLHTSDTTSYAEFNSHARGHDRIFRADWQSRSPSLCDPWEGTRGSGIIRFREESDWPLK